MIHSIHLTTTFCTPEINITIAEGLSIKFADFKEKNLGEIVNAGVPRIMSSSQFISPLSYAIFSHLTNIHLSTLCREPARTIPNMLGENQTDDSSGNIMLNTVCCLKHI